MILSIIVPVYNVEEYLEECLSSLINQKNESFEIICIDDGSTDNSFEILKNFQMNYPKLIKVYSKKNGGLAETRNYGISKSKGEYIGFVDSDDWVSIDMFFKLIEGTVKSNAEIGICDYMEVYQDKKIYKSDNSKYKLLYESLVCNKIFKRTLFIDNNIEFPVGLWYEDNSVLYKVLYLSNKIYKLNEAHYFYRRTRENSIMNSQNSSKIYDMWEISNDLNEFFKDKNMDNNTREQVEYIFFRNTMFRQIPKIIKYELPNCFKIRKKIVQNFDVLENKFPHWEYNSIILKDENCYFKNKIGKNHIKKIKQVKRNYLNLLHFVLLIRFRRYYEKKRS